MANSYSGISENEVVDQTITLLATEEEEEPPSLDQVLPDAVDELELIETVIVNDGAMSNKRAEKSEAFREPGKSLLPASRVLKIIKADEVRDRNIIHNT
jgi:hypothetical protein